MAYQLHIHKVLWPGKIINAVVIIEDDCEETATLYLDSKYMGEFENIDAALDHLDTLVELSIPKA